MSDPAADLAGRLADALTAAGYDPQEIAVRVEHTETGALELRIQAEVPGLDEAALMALLVEQTEAHAESLRQRRQAWFARLLTALVLGLALGVLGLPSFELPMQLSLAMPFRQDRSEPVSQEQPELTQMDAQPTPTQVLAATPTPRGAPGVLFSNRFQSPIAGWPNDERGPAWFDAAGGGYHLYAREPGRFVVVGVPLTEPAGNVVVTAHLKKVGGPSGGGFGIVVRDQAPPSTHDGRNQEGRFILLEVGDKGDVGIWQRDGTRWTDILPWTHAPAVNLENGWNELVVTTIGAEMRFDVNGARAADVSYNGIPARGGIGIFAGGDLNHIVLDWLRIDAR